MGPDIELAQALGDYDEEDGSRSHRTESAETLDLPGTGENEEDVGNLEGESQQKMPMQMPSSKQTGLGKFFESRPDPKKRTVSALKQSDSHETCFVPPVIMESTSVASLDDMHAWATQYARAIEKECPGALTILQEKLETTCYSTCFSGVDAPGCVS